MLHCGKARRRTPLLSALDGDSGERQLRHAGAMLAPARVRPPLADDARTLREHNISSITLPHRT